MSSVRTRRTQAARKMRKRLAEGLKSRCNWCHRPVVFLSSVPTSDRRQVRKYVIEYVVDGLLVASLQGTVDHVNGTRDNVNIVVACGECNCKRGRPPKRKKS